MVDELAVSPTEAIHELLKVLQWYADGDNLLSNLNDDLQIDYLMEGFMCPGRRAKEAIEAYSDIAERLVPSSIELKIGDIRIVGEQPHSHGIKTFVDGVEQKGLRSVSFEAVIGQQPLIRLVRSIL